MDGVTKDVGQMSAEELLDSYEKAINGADVLRARILSLLESGQRAAEMEEAATELLDAMETCHVCKGQLVLEESPIHCEDCSFDCEEHDEPECTPIYVLHQKLRKAIAAREALRKAV